MAKVSFNGINREIIVLPGVEEIDAQIDLYSAWKEWVLLSDNAKYPAAFRTFGGDPTIGGQFAPRYFFLINNWEVVASSVSTSIQTNLYTDGTGTGVIIDNAAVSIRNSDAAVVDNALEESLDYNGVVYINTRTGTPGNIYPSGTIAEPVDNLTDALIIAANYGINKYNVRGNLDINVDVTNSIFEAGESDVYLDFKNVDVNGCKFERIELEGTMNIPDGGSIVAIDGILSDLSGFNGVAKNCLIEGNLTLSNNHQNRYIVLDKCSSAAAGYISPGLAYVPEIRVEYATYSVGTVSFESTTSINVRGYAGDIGLTGSFKNGDIAEFDLLSGGVTIYDSIGGGDITIRGIGNLYDLKGINLGTSDFSGTLDTTGFYYDVENSSIINAYNGVVQLDPIDGSTGSHLYPYGTLATPAKNIQQALNIAEIYGFHKINLHGDYGVVEEDLDLTGYTITSESYPPRIILNGGSTISSTRFINMNISGTFSNIDVNSGALIENSVVGDLNNFSGIIYNSGLAGEVTLSENSISTFTDCKSLVPGTDSPVISKYLGHTTSVSMNFRAYSGGIRIKDWNNPADVTTIEYIAGRANIDVSCVEGTIVLRGDGTLNNQMGTASNVTLITDGFQSDINDHLERIEPEVFRIGGVVDNIENASGSTSSQVFDLLQGVAATVSLIQQDTTQIISNINQVGASVSLIYEDTNELVTDVNYLVTRIDVHSNILNQIAGLVQKNYRIFNQSYNAEGNLLSATIRTYPTAIDADNNTNADYTYTMTAAYDSEGKLTDYKVTEN